MGVASDLEAGDFLVAGVGDVLGVEEVSEVGDSSGVTEVLAGVDFLVGEEIMEDIKAGAEAQGQLPMEEEYKKNL